MRPSLLLRGFSIVSLLFCLLFCAAGGFAQNPPPTPVPFITQVTPPSLPPGSGNFTLTFLGANFEPGEAVTLSGIGISAITGNTTVNATGTQMVATFTNGNVSFLSPGIATITITKRINTGAVLATSSPYYLPVTPSNPSVFLEPPVLGFMQGSLTGLAAADFNSDGISDLAVVSQSPNGVSILTGNYGGPFTVAEALPTGNGPTGIIAADINGDGVPDLAIANAQDNTVTIFIANIDIFSGRGTGTFQAGITISVPGVYPTQLVAGDFNGDGKVDLAVLNLCGTGQYGCLPVAPPTGPGNVAILLNNGDGTFTVAPTLPATGIAPIAIAAADLNQDGFIDLIVANSNNTLTILMGNGDGTFSAAPDAPLTGFSGPPTGMAIGDFNGDGTPDVAVTSSGDQAIAILLNQNCAGLPAAQCSLTLQPTAPVATGLTAIATADMNGDGFLDLVVLNSGAWTVSVLLGDGTGHFAPPNQSFLAGNSPQALALMDINLDGRLDVVTSNQSTGYSLLRQASVTQLQLTTNIPSLIYGIIPTITVLFPAPIGATASPSGTVNLFDGATQIASATSSSFPYQTQFLLPPSFFFGAGTHQLTAVYSGDQNFAPVTSNTVTETVAMSATTTTLSSDVTNMPYGAPPLTLTAKVQPQYPSPATGTVTFTDTTNSTTLGTATVSNNTAQRTLSNLGVGVHTIVATYPGDANCTGSTSSSVSVTITQASTTTTVSASPNQPQFGQSVTFTAALQSQFSGSVAPTGTVTFLDGSTSLGTANVSNSAASLSVSTLAVGGHVITAQYSGDSNYQASSNTLPQPVSADATTTTITSNANPSSYGQGVTYTVSTSFVLPNLGTPSGLVTLYDGSTVLSSAFLSKGSVQFTVSSAITGTHSITAQYGGTTNYAASTSTALTQTVNPSATTTSVSASPNPSSAGQSVTLYGTLQSTYGLMSTGGTITFYNNSTHLGSVVIQPSNIETEGVGSATFQIAFVTITTATLPTGSQPVTVKYSGDANLQASTGSMTQMVNPAFTNMTVIASPGAPTYPQNVTFTATLIPSYGNTPTGTVTFSMNGTTLATVNVSNNTAAFTTSTPLPPGGHTINAVYSGDANDASSAGFASITMAPPPTTTVLTSSVNPSSFNQNVVLVATPQSSFSGTPTGTMTFFDGTTMIGSGTLVSGSAQLSISGFQTGTHPLTATYSGDFNFAGSTSVALSQVVNPGPTVTTVTSLDNPMTTPYNVRFLVTTTATYGGAPSGTVTLYDGSTVIGSGFLTNNPNVNTVQINVTGLTGGSHSITAKYSGSAFFGASTSTVLTQVMNLPGTSTSLSTSTNPVGYGQSVTLTAALIPGAQPTGSPLPSGTVTFFDGATSLGNGTVANNSAQISVSSLSVGSHTLTAKYNGDSNYTGSTSLPFTETVNQATTTATLSSNASPAAFGQSVTFTASIVPAYGGTATGTIAFLDGTTSLGSAAVSNNSAQFTISSLAVGSHSITAKYSGDANFTASTSSAIAQTINVAATTTTLISSLNPASYGQSVTLSASIQAPSGVSATGTVTFLDGSTSLGTATVSSNAAQLALSSFLAGTHAITAVYGGNSNLAGSTSSAVSEVVNPATTSTSISSSANPATVGQVVTFTASVQPAFGGAASGSVSFSDGATLLGTVGLTNNSGQLSVSSLSAGPHSITAAYTGDGNTSTSTSNALSQTINPVATTTTVTASPNPVTVNQGVTFVVTVSPATGGTPTGTVTLMDGTANLGGAILSAGGPARITYSGLPPGTHSITAVYSGDANFTASTSTALTVTVNPASSTTVLSSSLNPSTYGQAVTLTATVQAPQGINPSGTMTFMDGPVTLGSPSLSNGSAQFTLSGLAAGSHNITAVYGGNTYLTGSTSPGLAQSVNAASSTVTVSSSANPAAFGQTIILSAAVQPAFGGGATGTVTFYDGATSLGSANLSSNSAQLPVLNLAVGSHSITASYAGDANVSGNTSVALSEIINQVTTTTTLVSSLNPAPAGQSVTFTATVQAGAGNSATGTVTFLDGSTTLGTATLSGGSAQLTTSSLAPGSHSITVAFSGSTNFAGSTSAVLTETVNQITTNTTLAPSANPALAGQSVTFTATVQAGAGNSATGTVTFLDGSTTLGTATLSSGSAQLTTSSLAPGSHSITAAFSGSTNFAGSTSAVLTETVNQLTTTTTLACSVNPALAGQSVTFTATVQAGTGNSATGTVTFFDGSTTLGTASLSNNSAQFTASALAAGSHAITATYGGSTDFSASTSAALTETVNQSSTTTALVSNVNPATFGQQVPFVATVQTASGGSATGTVTFYDGTTALGTAAVTNNGGHNTATLSFAGLQGGTHSLTATYSGDANYTGSTSSALTQTINPASSSVTVGASANPASFGQAVTLTATVVPSVSGTLATGAVTFFDGGTSLGSANLSNNAAQVSVGNFALGAHSITVTYAGDRNFSGSTSAAFSEVVNPAATSTVVTPSANPILVNSTVTFTATVSSSSLGTRTGTVSFYLDGSSTAAASVNLSNGTAKYSTSSLSAGNHSVVAVFNSTNPDFAGSTSPALTQYVSDFTVAMSPSSLTVARGTSGTYTLTVTPVGEFSGNVSLTCGGAPGGTTCAISPTQVTLSGSGSLQATVTITAAQNASKGTHTLTFTGTSGSLNHKVTASLTIN